MMKIQKEHIVGVALGLIPLVILHFVLQYQPLSKTEPTVEQENTMPAISSPYKASVDDIRLIQLQIEAVTIDMHRYLGWFPEEKEMLKKASIKSQHDLQAIKGYLQQLRFTGHLAVLKEASLAVTDELIQLYDGIELKKQEDIKEFFAAFNVLYSQYSENLEESFTKNTSVEKLPEHFDPMKEQIKFGQNQQDRQLYLNAVKLIENNDFVQAYEKLTLLKKGLAKHSILDTLSVTQLKVCFWKPKTGCCTEKPSRRA